MIVLDASAALDIVRATTEGNALRQLIMDGEHIVAPRLFVSEVANALLKYVRAGYCDINTATAKAHEAYDLVDEFVSDEELMPEALLEAAASGHPAYDMFYLVLARRRKATLLTRDRKLQAVCESRGVNHVRPISL